MKIAIKFAAAAFVAALCITSVFSQDDAPPARGGRGGPTQYWWVNKTPGGVYKPPMRPLWKLADMKQMHAGQNNWQEQIILDPEQDVSYNSGAPGTKVPPRMHPDTPTVYVVVDGQIHFEVEGQPPVTATRGAIVNIMRTTLFSFDVTGDKNAIWAEINPTNYKIVYPAAGPPPAPSANGKIVKVGFNHAPGPYTPPNRLMFNTFDDLIAACARPGPVVLDDHIFVNPLLGYVNPADNKCGTGRGNIGGGPDRPDAPPFDPHTTFGHMHPGPAEWWIIQAGAISGKFENMGVYHAVEGDVLYAAPMGWHQMAAEAPTGPSVRLAMGGYALINMGNTDTDNPGRGSNRN